VSDGFDGKLRDRFTEPPWGAESRTDCPDAEQIQAAARGEASFAEVEALLDHAAGCAACTVAWRFTREAIPSARRTDRRWLAIAAAVVVTLSAGVVLRTWINPPVELRSTARDAIRAAIPDGAELPRGAFVLRWTPGPPGTRYTVLVTDERLTPVARGTNLDATELRVSEEALAALPARARVLWQVRAILPDGTPVATPTFVARVAP
jgi:hypothetical protein